MSISSRVGTPRRARSSTGAFGVPYFWLTNCAHSSNSPWATIASKASSLTKWYSRPFTSPGRGDLVVTETESQMSGAAPASARRRALAYAGRAGKDRQPGFMEPPWASAASLRRWTGESAVEPSSPRLSLGPSGSVRYHRRTRSPARCADWRPGREPGVIRRCRALHDLPRPHLADPGHGLKQRRDLHLADRVIRLASLEGLRERMTPRFRLFLTSGTILAGLGRLLQGSSAGSGVREEEPLVSPRVSKRKHWFGMGK